ncbi:hypothetical protein WME90_01820 [Sorangium sp. So ce375]|uniref:hypothetical protein n=1 Tax=Sorangium sp. So ce375 TaxID=3133306 RepID=UPI003F5B5A5B
MRALHKDAEASAAFFTQQVAAMQAREKAEPNSSWLWEIELPRLQSLEREAKANEFVLRDLLGSQGPLPSGAQPGHVVEVVEIWTRLGEARARFKDVDRGEELRPVSELQEESRQACEPASPARGSRRAEALLPNESGPGGALTPAEPNATPRKKGRAHDP